MLLFVDPTNFVNRAEAAKLLGVTTMDYELVARAKS